MSDASRFQRFGLTPGALFRVRDEPRAGIAALVTIAVLVGGGGVAYGLANLVIQLGALLLLALSPAGVAEFLRRGPRALTVLATASCALPLLQLVPLPASVWTGLPGRELVSESLALAGARGDWFALSVASGPTLVAFLGTLAPLAIIVLGWRLTTRDTVRLQHLAVMLGLLCAGFGMVLVAAGNFTGLYPEPPQTGVLFGTFANRNSTAVFLVCCLLLLIALPSDRGMTMLELAMRLVAGLILLLAVVLTQSRSGIALLLLPLVLGGSRLVAAWPQMRGQFARGRSPGSDGTMSMRARLVLAGVIAAVTIAGTTALVQSSRVETSLARFDDADGMRSAMWEDAVTSASRYWPLGAGMGTFDDVFQVDESLEHVTPRRAGRAHNDYIEVAVEAGLAGLVLLLGWLAWCAAAVWRARRFESGWPAWGAGSVVLAIALQSIVDYPLRNQTMLCLAALAIVILARAAYPRDKTE